MLGCSSLQSKHSFLHIFYSIAVCTSPILPSLADHPNARTNPACRGSASCCLRHRRTIFPAGLPADCRMMKRQQFPKFWRLSPSSHKKTAILGHRVYSVAWFLGKNGKTGELGQDRLEVRWEAVMFLFNVVNLNVWLFLSVNLAKCFVGVVWLMFGLVEGSRVCWGCCGFTVSHVHLMLDAFFVSFHCILSYFTFTNWTFQRFFLFIT